VLLFARLPVGGVAWLRIVSAGLVFALWRKPWRAFLSADSATRRSIAMLGAVFAAMNYSFYIAIDGLPLGTVAAIEFAGPIALAGLGARSWRNLTALGLAAAGVYLITDVRFEGEPSALAWAFVNAVLFTIYIAVAHRISRSDPITKPIDRLGASILIAGVVITPVGLSQAIPAFTDLVTIGAGIGVGLTSSVIPYVFDQMAMTRLPRATYALFVALLPATAVVIGAIVLGQVPTSLELVAIGLVIGAVLTHKDHEVERLSPSRIELPRRSGNSHAIRDGREACIGI
jgi:inner membrane transporter RhtA